MSYGTIIIQQISEEQVADLRAMRDSHLKCGKTIASNMLDQLIEKGSVKRTNMIGECDGSTEIAETLQTWDELTQMLMKWNTAQQCVAFS